MSLNERIHESLTEVYLMSDKYKAFTLILNRIIADLIHEIRNEALILYKCTECLAMLDLLLNFSHLCSLEPLGNLFKI
jgi:DNA mismatch repair protein MSH4